MTTALNFDAEIEYMKELNKPDINIAAPLLDSIPPTAPVNHQVDQMINEGGPIDSPKAEELIDASQAQAYDKRKKHGVIDVQHFDLLTVRPYLKTQNARLTRKRYAETSIREYLSQIHPGELAEKYLEFYDAHPFYKEVCAGAKHHHWWKGGLEDHVREMIGIGMDLMDLYPGDMTFTKSDLIITSFLHDFDKIWIYRYLSQEERALNPKKHKEKQVFTYVEGVNNILDGYSLKLLELAKFGIVPTNEQWSAVLFHEGGYAAANFDYRGPTKTPGDTVMHCNHLAPFLHCLDMYSAMLLGRTIV